MNESTQSALFEKRLIKFSGEILSLCKKIPQNIINKPIISQIVRSGTSIGANYCEAVNASSRKDFKNKIFICKKESQETNYWLKLLLQEDVGNNKQAKLLLQECHELVLIFQKIIQTMSENEKSKK